MRDLLSKRAGFFLPVVIFTAREIFSRPLIQIEARLARHQVRWLSP